MSWPLIVFFVLSSHTHHWLITTVSLQRLLPKLNWTVPWLTLFTKMDEKIKKTCPNCSQLYCLNCKYLFISHVSLSTKRSFDSLQDLMPKVHASNHTYLPFSSTTPYKRQSTTVPIMWPLYVRELHHKYCEVLGAYRVQSLLEEYGVASRRFGQFKWTQNWSLWIVSN